MFLHTAGILGGFRVFFFHCNPRFSQHNPFTLPNKVQTQHYLICYKVNSKQKVYSTDCTRKATYVWRGALQDHHECQHNRGSRDGPAGLALKLLTDSREKGRCGAGGVCTHMTTCKKNHFGQVMECLILKVRKGLKQRSRTRLTGAAAAKRHSLSWGSLQASELERHQATTLSPGCAPHHS